MRRPAQQRGDSLEQLHYAERLCHVLVRIETESADLVRLLAACRENDYRNPIVVAADIAQHLIPVHFRQHEIEQHDVGPPRARRVYAEPPGPGDHHLVAFQLQVVLDALGEICIVLDEKDARGHQLIRTCSPGSSAGAASPGLVSGDDGRMETAGKATTKRAPPPSASSTQALPPFWTTRS